MPTQSTPSHRLMSLDALRGFDMFWILGADGLVQGLRKLTDWAPVRLLADQLEHVEWEGFHFYDLIFPLFVFLMGVSAVFSLERTVERSGQGAAYRRLITRSLLLYALGLLYYGGRSHGAEPETFRYVGVLQRIAICNLCAGIVILNCRWRGILLTTAALLIGYWALMTWADTAWFDAPLGERRFAEGQNLANYVDEIALPGFRWDGEGRWDPEGLLSHLPAVGSALLGALAGLLLRQPQRSPWHVTRQLLLAAVVCLSLGWLWSYQFPWIKKLWTSSFVLWAGGWSFLLLALFYWIIDVQRWQRWAQPFVWIGMNCITIYLLAELLDFTKVVGRVLHPSTLAHWGRFDQLIVSVLSLLLAILICRELYRRQIFLRV